METRSSWMWMREGYIWTFPRPRFRDAGRHGGRLSPLFKEVTTGFTTNMFCRRIAALIWIFLSARAAQPSLANVTERAGELERNQSLRKMVSRREFRLN